MTNKRIIFIDILKILASYLVVVNHTISSVFTNVGLSMTWVTGALFFALSKVAVPIYLLISGFLMFQKRVNFKNAMKKFGSMLLIFLIGTSFHYYFYEILGREHTTFLKSLYSTNITNIYWYMFLYLGILLVAPIISVFLEAVNTRYLIYTILLNFIFVSIVPIILKRLAYAPLNENFSTVFLPGAIIYLLIGHLLYREYQNYIQSKKIISLAIVIFIVSWLTFFGLMLYEKKYETSFGTLFWDDRYAFHVVILSVSLFVIVAKYGEIKINESTQKMIIKFSQASFFIFLISDFILFLITKIGLTSLLAAKIDQLFIRQVIQGIIIYLISITIGLSFYSILNRIKQNKVA